MKPFVIRPMEMSQAGSGNVPLSGVNVAQLDCKQCHGPVDEMEIYYQHEKLNMGWCINCHRDKGIAPPEDHKRAAGGDCQKCHY